MKTNIFIYITLIASLISCKPSKESEIPIIDYTKFIHRDVKLSEFGDDIFYIPLSNEELLPGILSVKYCGYNRICVASNHQIYVYDLYGRLINKIGHEGNGPGEYNYSFIFDISEENQQIYILDMSKNKVLVYLLDGTYQESLDINLSSFNADFDDISYVNGSLYFFQDICCGEAEYNWVSYNMSTKSFKYEKNDVPKFKTQWSSVWGQGGFKHRNDLFYWDGFCDTIYKVFPDRNELAYFLAINKYRLTAVDYSPDKKIFDQGKIMIGDLIETNSYFFMDYDFNQKQGFCLYEKNKNKFSTVEQPLPTNPYAADYNGYINDLDGGFNINPRALIAKGDTEYVVSWKDAIELKDYVASDEFKNAKALYPDKKKALEQLANKLNENDNPVLMLVKLKQ